MTAEISEREVGTILARLEGMDKAVKLLEKFPTAIDIAIANLQALHEEKFRGVGDRFTELSTRLTEGDGYKQTALAAALKSAETLVGTQQENFRESIQKTEDSFTKQIDGIKEAVDNLRALVVAREASIKTSDKGSDDSWKLIAIIIAIASPIASIAVTFLLRH